MLDSATVVLVKRATLQHLGCSQPDAWPLYNTFACQHLQTINSTAPLLLETKTARQHGIVDCEHENRNDSTALLLVSNKKRTTVEHFCFTTPKNERSYNTFAHQHQKINQLYNAYARLKQKTKDNTTLCSTKAKKQMTAQQSFTLNTSRKNTRNNTFARL